MQAQDTQFMQLALAEARLALAEGEFPVGCVLAAEGQSVAVGRRRNSSGSADNELDHAEIVALRRLLAAQQPSADCRRLTVYSTLEPCLMCFSSLLLSGIRRFVWAYEDVLGGGTALPLKDLAPFYQNMDVELVPGVLREESMTLFADFFQRHSYLQNTLLAEYTMEQWRKQQEEARLAGGQGFEPR